MYCVYDDVNKGFLILIGIRYEWNFFQMDAACPHNENTSSSNCLVPPGNKPLPDAMFTRIYGTVLRH